MIVLSPKPVGIVQSCTWCGAVFAYKKDDVYDKKWVYCPCCKGKNSSRLVLSNN